MGSAVLDSVLPPRKAGRAGTESPTGALKAIARSRSIRSHRRFALAILVTAVVLVLIGLYLGIGGGWLIALGGSWYYLIAGLAFLATAWLIWRRRTAARA